MAITPSLPETVYLRRPSDGVIVPVRHPDVLQRCLADGFVQVDGPTAAESPAAELVAEVTKSESSAEKSAVKPVKRRA